jgi:uncharacterized membrane protein YgcG
MTSLIAAVALLVLSGAGFAMESGQPAATPPAPTIAKDSAPTLTQEELDQMFAPLALYPDDLLTQVLMASTYPLEVVQANRWIKNNSNMRGDALAAALEKQSWDPSVKSLINVPKVLDMLDEDLDRTQRIGDAFLGQPDKVMATIQKLRAKAKEAGHLESSDKQTVTVDESAGTQVIVIESPDPEVIYVPTYNPTVVYGSWWYPSYPPYVWNPYPPGAGLAVGITIGLAWGYAWGHCDWHSNDIDIDIDRNTEFNRNIDRAKYKNQMDRGAGQGQGQGKWKHDASHRRGAPYRDTQTAQRYGGATASQAARSREAYRGRAESGLSGSPTPRTQPSSSGRGRAMDDMNRGQAAQRDSSRGKASRSSSGSRPSGGSRSGGSRGGGSRGGGGRGGGGRR